MRLIVCLVATAGMIALAQLDEPKQSTKPLPYTGSPKDAYHLVYFGEKGPIIIRLHIRIDGKQVRENWDQFLAALFAHLDRDGDGVLSQEELEQAPSPQYLSGAFFGTAESVKPADSRPLPEIAVS